MSCLPTPSFAGPRRTAGASCSLAERGPAAGGTLAAAMPDRRAGPAKGNGRRDRVRIVRNVVVGLLVVVLIAVLLGVGGLAWVTTRALPQTSGDLAVPGLHGEVSVARDANGLVNITASDAHDLFLAQGFVHAQERMWQMEVWRHISAGRLAELFGPSQVKTDRFIRLLGWR